MVWELRTVFATLVALATASSSAMAEDREPKIVIGGLHSHKVQIELHYMPQCPGCRQLISTSFSDAFHTEGFSDMADVRFVPWGKKHREDANHHDRVFDNVLESCALKTIGHDHQDLQFLYIDCIDHTGTFEKDPSKVDRSCAREIGLSRLQTREIEECAKSSEGLALAEENLRHSESIGMVHAPWIVVNGEKSEEVEDAVWNSLFHYVCELYTGPYRSKECLPEPDMIAEQL